MNPFDEHRHTLILRLAAAIAFATTTTSTYCQSLFGSGKFMITRSDDRFSTDGQTSVVGHNNRVSNKTIAGGIYIDSHGAYLDPIAIKSQETGKVIRLGFLLHNDVQQDSRSGDANMLGTPRKVSFLIDGGKLIQSTVTDAEQRFSGANDYVRMLNVATTAVTESAVVTLTPEDMAALASAHTVIIHIEGSTHDWTCEAKDIAHNFLPNIATFYREVVAVGTSR